MAPDTAWPSALLLGLQGVLVEDQRALTGAVDTVNLARRSGLAIRFVTNTATRHHDDLLQDLQQLGLPVEPSELATAPLAAKSWLEREQRRPLALAHPAIAPLFASRSGEQPDCVLLGDGRDLLSYPNLNAALELLMQGALLIGIGRNRRFREAGRWMQEPSCRPWSMAPTAPLWCWASPRLPSSRRWCAHWACRPMPA
jgi:ribonucleotide monophosphatase NagD (HAD superfamily)